MAKKDKKDEKQQELPLEEKPVEEKAIEDFASIEGDLKPVEEAAAAEPEKAKRKRKKKKPEPEPLAPMVDPELLNMFILSLTLLLSKFLGPGWIAKPQELPMLSRATDRWAAFHFPGLMAEHGPDVEMITAWGLYTVNRIDLPGMLAPPKPEPEPKLEPEPDKDFIKQPPLPGEEKSKEPEPKSVGYGKQEPSPEELEATKPKPKPKAKK